MMAYAFGIPLLAVLAVLESSLMGHLHFLDGRPNLVLLAVVAWSLTGRWREGMIWGLVGGLMLDLMTELPFGTNAIAFVLVSYLVSFLEGRFWRANLLMPLGVMLAASLIYHFFALGALFLMGREIDLAYALTRVILPSAFLNLLLAIPASQIGAAVYRSLYPPEVQI
jgi:rod shape-determining protein MreD